MKVKIGKIQETLIFPLWARAKDYERKDSLLTDKLASEILNKLDYDYTTLEDNVGLPFIIALSVRSKNLENNLEVLYLSIQERPL